MKKNIILLSCMALALSLFLTTISHAEEEFFYDIELKNSYLLFSQQNPEDMKIQFIIKDTEPPNTYFIESKVFHKILPTKIDEKGNWEYSSPPLYDEDNNNKSTYKFVEDDRYDKKVSFYNADTLNLVSTKIFSSEYGKKREIYKAIIRKGTDDFSNAQTNEVYTKEYIIPDKESGREGHYREQVMELMSDDIALDTYGFVFYLYKKILKEKISFYYVDKGFVRKVFINSERKGFVNYKNGKSSCQVYEIIYKSPPALFSVYIEETEERLPLKIEFRDFSLVLSEEKPEVNSENREEK